MQAVFKKFPLLLLALTFALSFTACEDDFNDDLAPQVETEDEMPEMAFEALPPADVETDPATASDPAAARLNRPCFRFEYPIEVALGDRTVVTAENPAQLRRLLNRVRSNGLRANFVYPFNVTLANGNSITIRRFAGFRRLFRACRDFDRPEREPCATINYPIDVTRGDSLITVNDYRELKRALRGVGTIVYPIDLTYTETNEVVTANNLEELRTIRYECFTRGGNDDRGEACYRVQYPIDLTIGDNRTVTVVDRAEWVNVVRRVNRRVPVRVVYPITLIDRETDAPLVIQSREDWRAAREDCVGE